MSVLPLHDHDAVTEAWRRQVRAGWGPGAAVLDRTDARVLVEAVLEGGDELGDLLEGLGKRCAREGTPLEEVTSWVTGLLEVLPRRARRHLDRLDVALALAAGWAEGTLERRQPTRNGLVPLGVLHVRLAQAYASCASVDAEPSSLYALVVLDAELAHLGPHASAAARSVLAEAALRTFCSGETASTGDGGRVLVLATRTTDLAQRVRDAVVRCEQSPLLAGTWVSGWVEAIGRDPRHAQAHLDDLACAGR